MEFVIVAMLSGDAGITKLFLLLGTNDVNVKNEKKIYCVNMYVLLHKPINRKKNMHFYKISNMYCCSTQHIRTHIEGCPREFREVRLRDRNHPKLYLQAANMAALLRDNVANQNIGLVSGLI